MELCCAIMNCVSYIEQQCDEQLLKQLLESDYRELYRYHYRIGMFIRNTVLHDEEPLFKLFIQYGVTEKDDMSDLIIRLLYLYEQEKRSHAEKPPF